MTKIYAVAEWVPEWRRHYITPGKRYALEPYAYGCDERGVSPNGRGFAWRDDRGRVQFSGWEGSAHLNGGDWTPIEEAGECDLITANAALEAAAAPYLTAYNDLLFHSDTLAGLLDRDDNSPLAERVRLAREHASVAAEALEISLGLLRDRIAAAHGVEAVHLVTVDRLIQEGRKL